MTQATHAGVLHESIDDLNALLLRFRDDRTRQHAATELYRRYSALVLREVRRRLARLPPWLRPRLDAEDVAQDAWKTAFQRITPEGITFATIPSFIAFLSRTAANKTRETRRHHAAEKRDANREVPLTFALAITRHAA